MRAVVTALLIAGLIVCGWLARSMTDPPRTLGDGENYWNLYPDPVEIEFRDGYRVLVLPGEIFYYREDIRGPILRVIPPEHRDGWTQLNRRMGVRLVDLCVFVGHARLIHAGGSTT